MTVSEQSYTLLFRWVLLLATGLPAGVFSASAQTGIVISKQPQHQTVCRSAGGAVFTVTASASGGSLSYRWYHRPKGTTSWRTISVGGDGSSYAAQSEGDYYCYIWVTGNNVEKTSDIATLTFMDTPTTGSINIPGVCAGSSITATPVNIDPRNSNITDCEWFLNGTSVAQGPVTGNHVDPLIIPVNIAQLNATLRLELTNGCGTGSQTGRINVYPTPPAPTVLSDNYCRNAVAQPLAIGESNATWYTGATGDDGKTTVAPTPDTSVPGTQTWWVSQTVIHENVGCEGYRAQATVVITPLSDLPVVADTNPEFCLNDQNVVLTAQGDNLKWYNSEGRLLLSAPQIITAVPGIQMFYVTQTQSGKCESPKLEIKVNIKARANEGLISLSDIGELCPYMPTVITVSATVPDPVFRWYTNGDKTGFLQTGNSYTTPALPASAQYYVTLEYPGFCESINPRAAIVAVNDKELPIIEEPHIIEVPANDGVCYATNVPLAPPLARDRCTPFEQLKIYTDPAAPDTFWLGGKTLTWWAEDLTGNKGKVFQTVIVNDEELPEVTCPENLDIIINDDQDSAFVTYRMDYSDNCGAPQVVLESGLPSGSWFKADTTTVVRHTVTDGSGNTVSCEFTVTVRHPYREMDVALRVSAYELCQAQQVLITPVVSGGSGKYTYAWKPRHSTNATMDDHPSQTTTYEVTVSDGLIAQTKSVTINVLETAPVKLAYDGRVDEIFEGDEVVVNATPGFASYKFVLNDEVVQEVGLTDQIAFMAELGRYVVRVFATDENYCVASDQFEMDIESRKLPNIFTPNHDGKNDIFLEGFDLTVFSRAGEVLYQGTAGWDGTYRGKTLPQGTYLYVVRRTMNNGEQRVFKGTVTLKM